MPCHNFVLPASRCPQRNYCQLELAVRLMVKEGLIIKCVGRPAVRREKYFPPAVFETTTTACAPRSILYPKGHSLACRNPDRDSQDKRQSKGADCVFPALISFLRHINCIAATDRAQITHLCDRRGKPVHTNKHETRMMMMMMMLCILRLED